MPRLDPVTKAIRPDTSNSAFVAVTSGIVPGGRRSTHFAHAVASPQRFDLLRGRHNVCEVGGGRRVARRVADAGQPLVEPAGAPAPVCAKDKREAGQRSTHVGDRGRTHAYGGPGGDGLTGGVAVFARRVAVIGTGYVGLTTGACLASLGHRVSCADLDPEKVQRLRRGEIDIREDGLAELVEAGIAAGRLSFVVGAAAALADLAERDGPAEVVFLCVPTPMGVGGVADLSAVEAVVEEVRDGAGRRAPWWSTSPPCRSARPRAPRSCWPATTSRSSATPSSSARARPCTTSCTPTGSSSARRPGGRGAGGGALRPARRADGAHRRGQRRDDQVRGELLPGDEAVVRQRARRDVRAARRRHLRRHRGHGLRPAHRAGVPHAGARLGRFLPAQGHQRVAAGGRLGGLRVPPAARDDRHEHPPVPADRRQDQGRGHGAAAGLAGASDAWRCSG